MGKSEKELSIDDRIEQFIDLKKSENSALKKIALSLQQEKPKKTNKHK